jgi:hypothetical protein
MFDNLEKMKKQLSELAGVINLFKSEAVQLKIVELILGDVTEPEEEMVGGGAPRRHKTTQRKKSTQKKESGPKSPHKKKGSGGAVANLTELLAGEFFKQPRTINDIIEYCKHKKARHFKANEFSGTLARLVRDTKLTRNKNKDKQYEYKKP